MVISGEVWKMSDADDMKSPNNMMEMNQSEEKETPIKRKRGRPKKVVVEKPAEETTDSPVVKRKRGRPKGSKNKNPKITEWENLEPKPVVTGPPRPRGRPRKWPVPDASTPKRGRGRPKKGESQGVGLPTMVAQPESESMITHDPVPPDEMFSDSVDSFD